MNLCAAHNKLKSTSRIYIIDCNPVALCRARHSSRGKVYDSQKTQKLVHGISLKSQHGTDTLFSSIPLHLQICFFMEMPQSKPQKHEKLRGKFHIFAPDLSNLIKYIEDVATKIIYHDDALIASISAIKVYDDKPRTEFTLSVL